MTIENTVKKVKKSKCGHVGYQVKGKKYGLT